MFKNKTKTTRLFHKNKNKIKRFLMGDLGPHQELVHTALIRQHKS